MIIRKIVLASVVFSIASPLFAAEIYNKDGNQLQLTGAVHARHYFSDDISLNGDNTFIRFGFKGKTRINEWLAGYAQWEVNVQANHTESGSDAQTGNATRLAYAGLNADTYGSLDYGRNWGIDYDVASYTDYAPIFNNLTFSAGDNFMTGRGTGLLTWRNHDTFGLINGLDFAVQSQGANDSSEATGSSRSATKQNGEGYGMSLTWHATDAISIVGAGSSSRRTEAQQALSLGKGEYADMWGAGIKYAGKQLYLATIYAETHNLTPIKSLGYANKTRNWEAVAGYQFNNGIKPQIGYFWSRALDVEGTGNVDLIRYVDLAMMYYFNENMVTYVDYKINMLDSNTQFGITNDDVIGFGLTYHF